MSPVARVLRATSIVICLIVVSSFLIFAVNETRGASSHQQEELNGGPAAASVQGAGAHGAPAHESPVHETIDSLSGAFTSPFKAVTAGTSSEWVVHGVNVMLALLLYGFGLGFIARVIRVRA